MVTDSRAPHSARRLHLVNQPRMISAQLSADGLPRAIVDGGRRHQVARIGDVWEVQEGWWRRESEQLDRMYVRATLADGRVATLFYDRIANAWFAQRY